MSGHCDDSNGGDDDDVAAADDDAAAADDDVREDGVDDDDAMVMEKHTRHGNAAPATAAWEAVAGALPYTMPHPPSVARAASYRLAQRRARGEHMHVWRRRR